MSRLAVKTEIAKILDAVAGQTPATVRIYTPKEQDLIFGIVFQVGLPHSSEERFTLGGLNAQKIITYTVSVNIVWVYDDAEKGEQLFDLYLDRIDTAMRAYQHTLSKVLTDPDTGELSQLVFVSEKIETSTQEPEALEYSGTGIMRYSAVKNISAVEIVDG